MSSNKHIVWILPGFAASAADDTCLPMMLDLLKYVQQTNELKVSIIALQYPYTANKYEIFGTSIYPMNGGNKWFKKIGVWKNTLRTLENLHQQNPIDMIHSFWLGDAALMGQAFSRQSKVPHICSIMGQDALKDNRHINNKRLKDLPIIAISEFQAEVFYKNTGKHVVGVVPFGMPANTADANEKKYDIIGVGSLIPIKNYEMWINIIELVKQSIPNIKTILVGDGEQRKELEKMIDNKKLGASIELVGQKKRAETLDLINQSKIFLHTAKYEGQGYIFVEAMSMKLAIVSTPVGYSIENEKIWKGTSPQAFADEIVHLLRRPDLKVSYQYPTVKDTYDKYMAFYTA